MTRTGHYYVLLIGCDEYVGQKSLAGCVNDIDAIERILLKYFDPTRTHIPLQITRLAAPHENAPSTSTLTNQTQKPTKANIVKALEALATPTITAADSVLIYYSGHGGQSQSRDRLGYYECLIACDGNYLWDTEFNQLLANITQRTTDVTLVLDCCHSSGAFRDTSPDDDGVRAGVVTAEPPDEYSAGRGSSFINRPKPDYIAISACRSEERAQEFIMANGVRHGFFTYGLYTMLDRITSRPEELRWSDIWSFLLHEIQNNLQQTKQLPQHAWLVGEPARRIFGGTWDHKDAGIPIVQHTSNQYEIKAGELMGVTNEAVVAVYGSEPAFFPPLNSEDDKKAQIGRLTVTNATPATAQAITKTAMPATLPHGARARLIEMGKAKRLRVAIDQSDHQRVQLLQASSVLTLTPLDDTTADITVTPTAHGWELSNDVNQAFATIKTGDDPDVMRIALEAYLNVVRVLRYVTYLSHVKTADYLSWAIRDCRDATALQTADVRKTGFPEPPRNSDGIYEVDADTPYCIEVENRSVESLYVTVFNCTAYGMVQLLGTEEIHAEDIKTLWHKTIHRKAFKANPDNPAVNTTDQIVLIATTRKDIDLTHLSTKRTIQQIIDDVRDGKRGSFDTSEDDKVPEWMALKQLLIIRKRVKQ